MQMSCPIREACDVLSVGQRGDEHAWKLKGRCLGDALTSSLRGWLQCSLHQPADTRVRPESSTKWDPSDTLASRMSRKAHQTKQQQNLTVLDLRDGYTGAGTFVTSST